MVERGVSLASAIKYRVESESRPGYRDDNFNLGLLFEGGCMTGVVSAGSALAIGKSVMGAFDSFWGVSAGSAIAAGVLADQPEAISIFYENVNNTDFFDPRRLLKGKPVVDISYLTHKVMKEIKPLDWRRVIDSPIKLHIMVTEAHQAEAVDFCHFDGQEDLLNAILYSCLMPVIAGPPAEVNETTAYTDGAVATGGICLSEALAGGCTHLLVLRSGPEGSVPNGNFTLVELLGYLLLKDEYPKLAQSILREFRKRYRDALYLIEEAKANNPTIEAITPAKNEPLVSPFEMDSKKLIRGARAGYRAAAMRVRSMLREEK